MEGMTAPLTTPASNVAVSPSSSGAKGPVTSPLPPWAGDMWPKWTLHPAPTPGPLFPGELKSPLHRETSPAPRDGSFPRVAPWPQLGWRQTQRGLAQGQLLPLWGMWEPAMRTAGCGPSALPLLPSQAWCPCPRGSPDPCKPVAGKMDKRRQAEQPSIFVPTHPLPTSRGSVHTSDLRGHPPEHPEPRLQGLPLKSSSPYCHLFICITVF